MDHNALFGELRSLAHRPGEASWAAICAAIEAADEDIARSRFVPYLEGNLRRWPAALREAPWAWVERALAGEDPPGLRLVGAITIMNRKNVYRGFGRLMRNEALAGVRKLQIDGTPIGKARGVRALASSPLASRIEELHIAQVGMDDDALMELLGSELPSLTALHLERNDLSQWGISQLIEKPLVLGLEELHVDANPIGEVGAELLASAPFTRLKVLSMGTTELGDGGIIKLCEGVGFSHVERLELARCEIGPVGASALEVTEAFPSLRYLSIWSNELGDVGTAHLAKARHMPALSYLGLARTGMGDEGLAAVAQRPGLTRLDARLDDFGVEGCRALAESEASRELTALFLSFTSLYTGGVEALFAPGTRLRNLRQLEMARCYVGADGAKAMAGCPELDGLRELELSANYMSDGVRELARAPFLSEVRMLGLESTGAQDDDAQALAQSPYLGNLVALYVGHNRFEEPGVRALVEAKHPRLVALDLGEGELGDGLRAELASKYVDAPARRVKCRSGSVNYTLSVLADLEEADWDAFADAVLGVDEA